jgi:hypothetical protein
MAEISQHRWVVEKTKAPAGPEVSVPMMPVFGENQAKDIARLTCFEWYLLHGLDHEQARWAEK